MFYITQTLKIICYNDVNMKHFEDQSFENSNLLLDNILMKWEFNLVGRGVSN